MFRYQSAVLNVQPYTVVIIAEISIVLTYVFLCAEDYRWWWRSILSGGSTALFVLAYAALYVSTGLLDISSAVGLVVYGGYMLIIVAAGAYTRPLFSST
jgi:transmembrane 9 superfamily protein 2/4